MSRFRSLYLRETQEAPQDAKASRVWPAVYRGPLPKHMPEDYSVQVRCESQLPRILNRKQLLALPTFTENRRITSKAGWTYYGQFKGVSFQTLFTLFVTPNLYNWVRLESYNGQTFTIERQNLLNYRILLDCDDTPLTELYGGPVLVHNFDHYIEYAIPHVKNIVLTQGDHEYEHPSAQLGFKPEEARVVPGDYYAIHHEKISHV